MKKANGLSVAGKLNSKRHTGRIHEVTGSFHYTTRSLQGDLPNDSYIPQLHRTLVTHI